MLVPEALVKERPCNVDWPVMFNVADWRLPVPVALVKVVPWREETPETVKTPPMVPNPEAEKFVEETDCKEVWPAETVKPFSNLPAP